MYKLNHVQTDLRNKLSIETKDELVHGIHDKKFQEEKHEERKEEIQDKLTKKKIVNKKYYTVNCYNYREEPINIDAVMENEGIENNETGIFIDKRK